MKMMMIEGEINNYIMVWSIAITSLCYSYTVGMLIPKGIGRLIALIPPIIILLLLPLSLTSINFIATTSFFLSWLSTFKLFLFAFNKGPLISSPPLSLPYFLLLASFPVKFQPTKGTPLPPSMSWFKFTSMVIFSVFAIFIMIFEKNYKSSFHPIVLKIIYILLVYSSLETTLSLFTSIARKLVQLELEQPFNKPHLSTSVQDFWGRRWNIMVTRILHPTVYEPMVIASSHVIGRKWAPVPAVVTTFAVSALMHELIFYYIMREFQKAWEPSWYSICFFLIHGVCVALQIAYKKAFEPKQQLLPTAVSRILTMVFVVSTSISLFVPAYFSSGVIEKTKRDYLVIFQFVNNVYQDYILPPTRVSR